MIKAEVIDRLVVLEHVEHDEAMKEALRYAIRELRENNK